MYSENISLEKWIIFGCHSFLFRRKIIYNFLKNLTLRLKIKISWLFRYHNFSFLHSYQTLLRAGSGSFELQFTGQCLSKLYCWCITFVIDQLILLKVKIAITAFLTFVIMIILKTRFYHFNNTSLICLLGFFRTME